MEHHRSTRPSSGTQGRAEQRSSGVQLSTMQRSHLPKSRWWAICKRTAAEGTLAAACSGVCPKIQSPGQVAEAVDGGWSLSLVTQPLEQSRVGGTCCLAALGGAIRHERSLVGTFSGFGATQTTTGQRLTQPTVAIPLFIQPSRLGWSPRFTSCVRGAISTRPANPVTRPEPLHAFAPQKRSLSAAQEPADDLLAFGALLSMSCTNQLTGSAARHASRSYHPFCPQTFFRTRRGEESAGRTAGVPLFGSGAVGDLWAPRH